MNTQSIKDTLQNTHILLDKQAMTNSDLLVCEHVVAQCPFDSSDDIVSCLKCDASNWFVSWYDNDMCGIAIVTWVENKPKISCLLYLDDLSEIHRVHTFVTNNPVRGMHEVFNLSDIVIAYN